MVLQVRDTLQRAIKGNIHSEQVLINICAQMAEAYLRTKSKRHNHLIHFSTASYPDFALDSIADLFQRKDGKLVIIEKWMARVNGLELSDSELFIQLRRLVFSAVNDHIFSSYKLMDSSLAKIIRNLKRGISEQEVEGLIIDSNDQSIQLVECNNLPTEINPEILGIKLSSRLSNTKNTLDILQIIRKILEEYEPRESGKIRITSLANIIRCQFSALNEIEQDYADDNSELMNTEEWTSIIRKAIQTSKIEFFNSYVVSNKLSDELYNAYFYITEEILLSDYICDRSNSRSFYQHFQTVYPDISKEMYKITHRVVIEYFVKSVRRELKRLITKEIKSVN